ncbi:MAG: PP2C family protein-serine/threonine phosphatase [Actinomycetes bacterium]
MVTENVLPPDHEAERMSAVRRYDVLDTPPDGAFDRIAALAARLFDVPIALVTIVDTDRIWFKSRHGLETPEIGRDPGLCASVILQDQPWVVSDARIDRRTLANPLVASDFGLRFYAGAPLRTADGFNLGTLCVIDKEPREVTEDQTRVLTDLASLVVDELELRLSARRAVAEAEQRLHAVQGLATALQASLLPPTLPRIPFLALSARYNPSSRYDVGGDFYDVFPIDERTWGVVIGDVCGKGPEAAGRTSCARYSLRAAAIHEAAPTAVLDVVNQALLAEAGASDDAPFVTALFARVEPHPDRAIVRLAVAGHPLPTLLRADGNVYVVGEVGTLLGVLHEVNVTEVALELMPGDTLLLVTDGVLDSGSPDRLEQDGLNRILSGCRGLPVDQLVDRVQGVVTADQRDDIAMLAVAVAGRSTPPSAG